MSCFGRPGILHHFTTAGWLSVGRSASSSDGNAVKYAEKSAVKDSVKLSRVNECFLSLGMSVALEDASKV